MSGPAPEATALPDGVAIIGATRIEETSAGRMTHVDPSNGKVDADFVLAGAREVDDAVGTARDAGAHWRALDAAQRRDRMLALADLLAEHGPELAAIRSRETGVPYRVPESGLAVEWLRYYAGWADKLAGETLAGRSSTLEYTVEEPYGVVATLIPWNAPLDSIGMKLAPALATGNTVVLKPSELAPFAAIRFGELCSEAGLAPGVVNVVPGAGETGAALVDHPGVDKISFTGGVATARQVLRAAAEQLTPVLLELGGKSANVVFADADLDVAARTAVFRGVVALSGQACVLPTRLLVQDEVYDPVVRRVVELLGGVRVGTPWEPGVQMGPVVTAAACERILGAVRRAESTGEGRLLAGGERMGGDLADGFFVSPTVFGDVDPDAALAREEIFGPVLAIMRFTDEAHAVELANSTRYGLGGLVFTRDLARAHRCAAAMEAGSVGVNGFPVMNPAAPFGGMKQSGFGREGGVAGLREFLRPKSVFVDLGSEG